MKIKKLISIIYLLVSITYFINAGNKNISADYSQITQSKIIEIENFIKKNQKVGKIPGLSIVIVHEGVTIYREGFGFADVENGIPVTRQTLFELGSTSKAFTGLGLLYLKEKGLLSLNDSITKYIPWFRAQYKNEITDIKLKHFLYQTSGIPYESIGNIPISNDSNALEDTVHTSINIELEHLPGERFLYASINYDVLGLVIEKITGQSFEEFMKNILESLYLKHTYINREKAYTSRDMAKGYKLGFLTYQNFTAPPYRGNTPAGYFISDSVDIARWMKIQYGAVELPEFWNNIIKDSHIPDRTVLPGPWGSSYASGWNVFPKGSGEISHDGENPNFSSYIVLRPEDKIGVAVLANLNSKYTGVIGQGIIDIMRDKKPVAVINDIYKDLDNAAFSIMILSIVFSITTLVFIVFLIIDFIKNKRKLSSFKLKNILGMFYLLIFIGCIAYCLYIIPTVLFGKFSWEFVLVWAPCSFLPSIICLFVLIVILCIYFQLIFFFPKANEKPFFPLVVLSFVSGFGNAFIIFTINEAINRIRNVDIGIMLYFVLGIVLYVIGQKLIRTKMVTITNDLIYEKRMELIENILNTSFSKIETIENGKIYAGLNNDTEMISNAPNVIIGCLTGIVTLICCFVYLGIMNIYGLFISIFVILIAIGLYLFVGRSANKLWVKTRDIQNAFFKFINDLIYGLKELSLNFKKRNDFKDDMEKSCNEYRKKNTLASLRFANVFVIGELLFTLVIGTVAFVFPYIFKNIQVHTVRAYIFVFLFMTGPVNIVLNNIPRLLQIRISWNRIKELLHNINFISLPEKDITQKTSKNGEITLSLNNIEFEYRDVDNIFKVGPINYQFRSGEIVFITGGNGSGKTTLVKLVTGLYKPDTGTILINNTAFNHTEIGEYYSIVFSDYYLFNKLYGIYYKEKEKQIREMLQLFRLDDKLIVCDGEFSTLDLSNGQRKRIALLVSYIEDKEIFIFDEWAADQDPEFRKYFYTVLLQDLKKKNKCVIAITHDEHYFHYADKMIKMEMGKIITES